MVHFGLWEGVPRPKDDFRPTKGGIARKSAKNDVRRTIRECNLKAPAYFKQTSWI